MRESNVQQVSTPPHVHDASMPLPLPVTTTRPLPGVLVAVIGTPFHGGVPTYDETLGVCVWSLGATVTASPMLVLDESTGEPGFLLDADGNPLYGFPE